MKKIFIVFTLLLLFCFRVQAQVFSDTYVNSIQVAAKNSLQSLVAHPKGSLTINVADNKEPVLTFIDVNGLVVWSNNYLYKTDVLVINAGVLTDGYDFIVVGSYASVGFAMKLDGSTGTVLWSNLYYPSNKYYNLSFTGIVRTGEIAENYVMAGTADPTIQDLPASLYFQNIDGTTGNANWVRRYHDAAFAPPLQPERVAYTVSHLARNPQNSHPNGDIMVVGHTYNDQQKYHLFTIGISEVSGAIIKVYEEVTQGADALHPHITFDGQGDYLLYYQRNEWLAALKTQLSMSSVWWSYRYKFPSFSENIQCSAVPLKLGGYKLNGWGYDPNDMQRKPFLFNFDDNGIPVISTGVWSYNANAQDATSASMVYAFGTAQIALTHGTADAFFTESAYDIDYFGASCLKEELPGEEAIPASFMPVKFRVRKDGFMDPISVKEKDWKHKVIDCQGNGIARPALASEATVPAGTLIVAPNPTESLLTLDGRAFATDQFLTIRDLTGKAVLETTLAAGQQQTLDVTTLPAGLYLITSADQQVAIRFVKK